MAKTEIDSSNARIGVILVLLLAASVGFLGYRYWKKKQEHYQAHHKNILTSALVDVNSDGKHEVLRVWDSPFGADECDHGTYVDLYSLSSQSVLWSRSDLPRAYSFHVIGNNKQIALISDSPEELIATTVLDLSTGEKLWQKRTKGGFVEDSLMNREGFAVILNDRIQSYRWSDGSSCGEQPVSEWKRLNQLKLPGVFEVVCTPWKYSQGEEICAYRFTTCNLRSAESIKFGRLPFETSFTASCDSETPCKRYDFVSPDHDIAMRLNVPMTQGRTQDELAVVSRKSMTTLWSLRSDELDLHGTSVAFNRDLISIRLMDKDLRLFFLGIEARSGKALLATKDACEPVGEGYTCGKILYTEQGKLVANDKNGLPKPDKDYRALLSKYQPNISLGR